MLEKVINFVGFGVCHQLSERSFHYGGVQIPVCARDTGIYFGFVISFLYLILTHKKHNNEMPKLWILIIAGLGILAMAFDGVSSYLGFRETTNAIRLITGLLTGFALPVFLVPIFNYQVWKESSNSRLLESQKVRIGLLILIALTYTVFMINIAAYKYFLPYLTAFAVIITFALVNLMIVTILPFWYQKTDRWKNLVLPGIIAIFLSGLEITLSASLHSRLQQIFLWFFDLIY